MGKVLNFTQAVNKLKNQEHLYTEIKQNNISLSLSENEKSLLTPLVKNELSSINISLNNAQKNKDDSSVMFWTKMRRAFISLNKKLPNIKEVEFIELDAILGVIEGKLQEITLSMIMEEAIDDNYIKDLSRFHRKIHSLHRSIIIK